MDIEYMDILGKNHQFRLLIWTSFIGQFVRQVGGKGDGVKDGMGCIVIVIASCQYHFIRMHENLVQHPSNNIISILVTEVPNI